jgi:hypothetical protein
MKLLIIGHARHGKDTVADILKHQLGLKAISSSEFACEHVVFPALSKNYGYKTAKECFEDRFDHRTEWFNLICTYNDGDKARLAREIMLTSDVYIGMRCEDELQACKEQKMFDRIIWVDASQRIQEQESTSSCTVTSSSADIVVSNNGTLEELTSLLLKIF